MSTEPVPFNDLHLHEEAAGVAAAIERVVARGWFVLGPEVEAFEHEFAAAAGTRSAVGVGTGTDAIALALRALGVGPGDEVVTTPLSAAYTALAVVMAGARPVFADIDEQRLTMDPAAVEAAITTRTVAVLPVHLYGQAADMDAIAAIASKHGLAIVEDCCQAHLATCGGRPVGTFGAAGAFSFYPTKNLGALGDGGAIVTSDAALTDRLRLLRNGGQRTRYRHDEFGVNSRLDELQAAILRTRLPRLRAWTDTRRALANVYRAGLEGAPINVPRELDAGHVYHLFPVRSDDRSRLQQHLLAHGIETLIHYPVPIPRQPALADQDPGHCPVADRVCGELVSLPLYPSLQPEAVARTVAALQRFGRAPSGVP